MHFGKISFRGRVQARVVEPEPNQFWMAEAKNWNFKIQLHKKLEIWNTSAQPWFRLILLGNEWSGSFCLETSDHW